MANENDKAKFQKALKTLRINGKDYYHDDSVTKKTLQQWYNGSDVTYSEKEKLNRMGVSDYDSYVLQNLKQMLICEDVAKKNARIKSEITGLITRIDFFHPRINTVNFTTNYSVAFVENSSGTKWLIIYRPSYTLGIESDLLIKTISGDENESNVYFFKRAVDCMTAAQKSRNYIRSQELTKHEEFDSYIELKPNCKIQ